MVTSLHFMQVTAPSLAPILRSTTQGRLLAALMLDPDRELAVNQLAQLVESTLTTTAREVERAELAGLATTRKLGNTRLARANEHHPLYPHVRAIIVSTFGVPNIVTRAFRDVDGIRRLLIVGSWAARWMTVDGPPPNDIDLLLIGRPPRDTVDDAATEAERQIGLPVNVVIRSQQAWVDREDPFVAEVRARPIVDLSDRLKGDTS